MENEFVKIPILRGTEELKPLKDLLIKKTSALVCGGYARYCTSPVTLPVPPGDLDLFFRYPEGFEKAKDLLLGVGHTVKFDSPLAVSLIPAEDASPQWKVLPTIQLIKPRKEGRICSVGELDEVLSYFDFTVTRVGFTIGSDVAIADTEFLEDEKNKKLRLRYVTCPVSSLFRIAKYSKKGYRLTFKEVFQVFKEWDDMPDTTKTKLTELLSDAPTQEQIEEMEAMVFVD